MVGKTHANALGEFAGVKQTATPEGTFVIGLHREAKAKPLITITHKGKKDICAIDVKKCTYITQHINGLNQEKVTPLKNLRRRLAKERAEIWNAALCIVIKFIISKKGYTHQLVLSQEYMVLGLC